MRSLERTTCGRILRMGGLAHRECERLGKRNGREIALGQTDGAKRTVPPTHKVSAAPPSLLDAAELLPRLKVAGSSP